MDLHKRTGWRLEDADEMVEQLGENNLCVIDKNEATEISDFQKRAKEGGSGIMNEAFIIEIIVGCVLGLIIGKLL